MPIRVAQIIGKMDNGGVESVVMNYYRNIDKSKIQFDFIIDIDSKNPLITEIESLGGHVYLVSPYQKLLHYLIDVYKVIRKNKYKIVHSHLNTLSIFPLFSSFLAGAKVRIAHSHSTSASGEGKKTILKNVLRPLSRLFSTHYCACSEYAGKWLFGEKSCNSGRIVLIKNAINVECFSYKDDVRRQIRENLKLENKYVIGHIGRFVYQKNHSFLIDIFNEIYLKNPNSALILIGSGELEGEILQKVDDLGLSDSVQFLGVRQDIPDLIQALDVLLLPSFYEGLPLVGVEAQAAGLPCIMSNNITKEAKLIESTKFCNLSLTAREWALEVLYYSNNFDRSQSTIEQIEHAGFEIKTASNNLRNLYLDLYGEVI